MSDDIGVNLNAAESSNKVYLGDDHSVLRGCSGDDKCCVRSKCCVSGDCCSCGTRCLCCLKLAPCYMCLSDMKLRLKIIANMIKFRLGCCKEYNKYHVESIYPQCVHAVITAAKVSDGMVAKSDLINICNMYSVPDLFEFTCVAYRTDEASLSKYAVNMMRQELYDITDDCVPTSVIYFEPV